MTKQKTRKNRGAGTAAAKYTVKIDDKTVKMSCDLCEKSEFIRFDGAIGPTKLKNLFNPFGDLGDIASSKSITMLICASCKLCKTFESGHNLQKETT
jgi:hypothetical protein